ncbi:molybdopterin-dependent oxidoreductase [Streptomyces sp. GMY02]|nr:molybdopterin-dependent oxidoreductase [Streptomyces sp. GMY02]
MTRPSHSPDPTPSASPSTSANGNASTSTSTSTSSPSSSAVALLLAGEVERPVSLTVADLRERWEQHRADVVFHCATSGPRHHVFEGPLLREVVDTAKPAFDARRRKDRSRFLLAVTGGDGHHTVLSWAELDADFGNVPVLLATTMDGERLDTAGSQLVVPSDHCGARYISAITNVWVGGIAGRDGGRPGTPPLTVTAADTTALSPADTTAVATAVAAQPPTRATPT